MAIQWRTDPATVSESMQPDFIDAAPVPLDGPSVLVQMPVIMPPAPLASPFIGHHPSAPTLLTTFKPLQVPHASPAMMAQTGAMHTGSRAGGGPGPMVLKRQSSAASRR